VVRASGSFKLASGTLQIGFIIIIIVCKKWRDPKELSRVLRQLSTALQFSGHLPNKPHLFSLPFILKETGAKFSLAGCTSQHQPA